MHASFWLQGRLGVGSTPPLGRMFMGRAFCTSLWFREGFQLFLKLGQGTIKLAEAVCREEPSEVTS